MRSPVASSIIAGLSVASILGVAGAVTRTGLLTVSVPLWSLIAVTTVSLCFAVWRIAQRRTTKRTFLIIPAFIQKHWVAELIQNTHHSIDRRAMDVVLKIPDKDYSGTGQTHHFRRVLSQPDHYDGGFIVPAEVNLIRHDLISFCTSLAKPVVIMDVEPFDDVRDYPADTAFIGYDSAGIGECAAEWVVNHLASSSQPDPTVLVIGSREQSARQRRFKEVIDAKLPEAHLVIDDDGVFARMRASAVVRRRMQQLRLDGRELAVIFCTNDELALGAVDALFIDGSDLAAKVVIIGVDGTPEARALIDTGHSPLRATVVQDSYRISEIAVDLLEKMLKGEPVTRRTLLAAELYIGDG
jgi:ribose transport system substrate-binding protein